MENFTTSCFPPQVRNCKPETPEPVDRAYAASERLLLSSNYIRGHNYGRTNILATGIPSRWQQQTVTAGVANNDDALAVATDDVVPRTEHAGGNRQNSRRPESVVLDVVAARSILHGKALGNSRRDNPFPFSHRNFHQIAVRFNRNTGIARNNIGRLSRAGGRGRCNGWRRCLARKCLADGLRLKHTVRMPVAGRSMTVAAARWRNAPWRSMVMVIIGGSMAMLACRLSSGPRYCTASGVSSPRSVRRPQVVECHLTSADVDLFAETVYRPQRNAKR